LDKIIKENGMTEIRTKTIEEIESLVSEMILEFSIKVSVQMGTSVKGWSCERNTPINKIGRIKDIDCNTKSNLLNI